MQQKEYDVALSFAGEERIYVKIVADSLVASGISVFYDEYEEVSLWGKNILQHLQDIYQNKAKFVVIFASKNYARKLWTTHELEAAQAKAFELRREYILPARFDDTEIPGILPTIGYIDLTKKEPHDFASLIIQKIGAQKENVSIPPIIQQKKESSVTITEKEAIWYSTDGLCPKCNTDQYEVIGKFDGGGTVIRRCKKCNEKFRYDYY